MLRIPLMMGIVFFHFSQHGAAQNVDELLLAGLPVVVVETVDGEEPTYEVAEAPEDYWGISIKNATKVSGRVQIYDSEGLRFDSGDYVEKKSGMTIKIRGNTTALTANKPYKIKLQKKADMLGRDDRFKDKDWLLLNVTNMNMPIGMMVNELCGSNVFLTKHDNEADTLIRMGCLWDFDGIMNVDDTWDDAHNCYIFRSLWNSPNDAFSMQYVSLWESINEEVYQGLTDFFDGFLSSDLCQAVERSIELNNKRWNTSNQLHDRAGGIVNPIFDLQGRQIGSSLKNGIYIQNGRKVVRR